MSPDLQLAIDILAIALSLVALTVTIVGFFASLKFYRDGTDLQMSVRSLLASVSEQTSTIESKVGGLFEKTLDAAIGIPTRFENQETPWDEREKAGIEPDDEEPSAAGGVSNLATDVMQLLAFEGLGMTNVSGGLAGTFFRFGSSHGFNLLDGQERVLYLGYFRGLRPPEVIARTRFLLRNIRRAWDAVLAAPESPEKREGLKLFERIGIWLVVSDDTDTERLAGKLEEIRPEDTEVPIEIYTPSRVQAELGERYEDFGYDDVA